MSSDTGALDARPRHDDDMPPALSTMWRALRLGFRHDNLGQTLPEVAASANLAIDAVYTHFATADDPEHPLFAEQRLRFERVLGELPAHGIRATLRHASNSAALLRIA